jgi:putative salt-induced outer membrane protein YdiY
MNRPVFCALVICLTLLASSLRADQILFKNGDRLTGKIETFDGSKLTINSASAGKVSVEMKNVQTISSDSPIEVVLSDGSIIRSKVIPGPEGQITLPPVGVMKSRNIAIASIKKINPPPVKWTGTVVVGGMLSRGNTNTENINASVHLMRRTEKDRITLDGGYQYGRQNITGQGSHETQNNWFGEAKYDYFFTPRLYGYGDVRAEQDVIAELALRLTPGVGAGYQWVDKPTLTFNTEGGASWLYRDYANDGVSESVSLRLAYHLTAKLNDKVAIFNNFEYFPSVESISNYYFNTDAGIRTTLTDKMFAEFKAEWRYDSRPAPGKGPNDTRYIVGVGWTF